MTFTVDNAGTLEQSSASGSSAAPHETSVVEFTLFNNLKTYDDHQDQILHLLCYEVSLTGTDRKWR